MPCNRKGQALVLVLLMTTVIFLVGGAALTLGTAARKNATLDVSRKRAYYIAEAGVEKALARAKSDPAWLRSLPLRNDFTGTSDEIFLENVPYPDDDNVIESVRVIKTNEDVVGNGVTIKMKSVGKTLHSSCTLVVEAEISHPFPENLFRGIWVNNFQNLPEGHGVKFNIDTYVSEEDVIIPEDSEVTGNIYCKRKAILDGKQKNKAIKFNGEIYALDGVYLAYVEVPAGGKLDVYVDSDTKVQMGQGVSPDVRVNVLSTDELLAKMPPPLPELLSPERLTWYKNNADFCQVPGDLHFTDGIYYVEDDLGLAGEYSGRALLVVDGDVTVGRGNEKYLRRKTADDCLVILATGRIITHNAQIDPIEAFLYAQDIEVLKNGTRLVGGAVAPTLKANGCSITAERSDPMLGVYESGLTWTTAFVTITKWTGQA